MSLRASPRFLYLPLVALSLLTSALVATRMAGHFPRVHDEFSYLLAGQTFSQFRLANPTPPLWRFFETHHVLMEPSLMSKYPPGQGLALAVGFWLGDPIRGVWLSCAAFAAAVAWMLRGVFSSRWALLGGGLAIAQFGLTHYWAQSFWGGALAATGGALVFGGTLRLLRSPRRRDAALLGLGVVLLALTRPFEGLLACLVPAAAFAGRLLRPAARSTRATHPLLSPLAPAAIVIAVGLAFLGYYHFRVTGSPFRLPYFEYEHRYAGTPYFIWQSPAPVPDFQTPALAAYYHDYMVPLSRFHGNPLVVWPQRLWLTARNFLGPLLFALAALALVLRPSRRIRLALASVLVCSLAMILSYWISSHYQAVAAALYLFLAVAGLRTLLLRLPRPARRFMPIVALLLAVQAAILARDPGIERDLAHRTLPPPREKILATLHAAGGRHLIFVRLEPPLDVHAAWVANDVPLGSAAVLWAWDRGPAEDRRLLAAFPDRHPLFLTVRGDHLTFTEFAPAP